MTQDFELGQIGLETKNQFVDVITRLNEQWEHGFTLSNPLLVENYLKGKLHFLVVIEKRGKPGNQFVAFFERALSELTVGDDVEGKVGAPKIDIGRNRSPFVF